MGHEMIRINFDDFEDESHSIRNGLHSLLLAFEYWQRWEDERIRKMEHPAVGLTRSKVIRL